jgi:Cys-rich repeat protein
MKKLLLLVSLPAALLVMPLACDGGSATPCTTDDDCPAGEICDVVSAVDDTLICQVSTEECSVNADCQIGFNLSGNNLDQNQECDSASDCPNGETCALGFDDQGYCVILGSCGGAAGAVEITADLADGGTAEVCVDAGTTCESGTCEA